MASKCKLGFVHYEDLSIDLSRNVRDADNYDAESLSADIEQNGVLTPILVSHRTDGTTHVLRGHRRTLAIGLIKSRNQKRYDEIAAKIPATIYEGLTLSEEVDLLTDHSSVRDITRKSELYRTVAILLRNGFSEGAVAVKCDPLFARMVARDPEGRLKALQIQDLAERMTALLGCWRGRIQEIHNVLRLPQVVEDTYLHQNGLPDPDNAFQIPVLTTAKIQKLYSAHLADVKSQSVDGTLFQKRWDAYCEEDRAKANGSSEPKVKRMSAGDIEDRRLLYRSNAVRGALGMVLGEEVDLDRLDRLGAIAELLADKDPAFWKMAVERYDAIRREMATAKQTAAEIVKEG